MESIKNILATNCIIINGHLRSTLCDVQNEVFYIISKELAMYLSNFEDTSQLSKKDQDIIAKLYESGCILQVNSQHLDAFIPLPETYKRQTGLINDCIICCDDNSKFNWYSIISSLEVLKCRHLEIRLFEKFSMEEIEVISSLTVDSTIESIYLYSNFDYTIRHIDELIKLRVKNARICYIFLFNVPLGIDISEYPKYFVFSHEMISGNEHCGVISPFYFTLGIQTILDAKVTNTCLDGKISIDQQGWIRNCPSMVETVGNIETMDLVEANLQLLESVKRSVPKDKVHVCKDCEFRYICTDCRAYVEDPADLYSKPIKCGYNPYTAEWFDWAKDPNKQHLFKYYNFSNEILNSSYLQKATNDSLDVFNNLKIVSDEDVYKSLSFNDILKGKFSLVYVWASWCKACLIGLKELDIEVAGTGFQKVSLCVLSSRTTWNEALNFIQATSIIQTHANRSMSKSIVNSLKVNNYPTILIFNKEAQLTSSCTNLDEALKIINKLKNMDY